MITLRGNVLAAALITGIIFMFVLGDETLICCNTLELDFDRKVRY